MRAACVAGPGPQPPRGAESLAGRRALLKGLLLIPLGVTILGVAGAESEMERPPVEVVRQATEEVLEALRTHHEDYEKDPGRLRELINKIAAPHIDLDYIGRYVLGPHWRQATPEQKTRFSKAFATYVINTYIKAMIRYADATVQVLPPRGQGSNSRIVRVSTVVRRKNAGPISIDYRLHRRHGQWLVVDVIVDGVSLVINYRRTFGSAIGQKGMDRLIEDLEQRNAAFDQGTV